MRNRFLVTLTLVFALIAAACGSSVDSATDGVDDAADPVEEVVEEAPVEEETTTTTAVEEESEPVADDAAAGPVDGQAIYEANCTRCHAEDGSGGRGPSLQGIAVEQPDQSGGIEQVTNGGGGMPAFGSRLSAEEIQATIDYVWDTF